MIYRLLRGKLHNIVGEEDDTCVINIESKPYNVGDIVIPGKFDDSIDSALKIVDSLNLEVMYLFAYFSPKEG
jgi:hypothetical protein